MGATSWKTSRVDRSATVETKDMVVTYEDPFLSKAEREIRDHNKRVKSCPPTRRWWWRSTTHAYKTGWLEDKTRVKVCQKCGKVKLNPHDEPDLYC